ncbi:respiratory chain complex I subunit 1 family protein [Pontiella sulfatireligans]|uniref:Formate hydrogenlyase subunit 4 n=1 Tax=Pontiella sulfatireligans TaxID=2750658 RepID=A0A6C2UL43_9BACT|nr:NADH-quinone oxidoreductase subunit H [Pontiella sulfatireligans]VGO20613.1 Formate hydrogenlyase subunit 4 [Pontiella sulfatireligans]
MINLLVHFVLMLAMPPLLLGVINKTKALFAGRKGLPLLQNYYDLIKLARKDVVISQTTTWIFVAAPVISLTGIVMAGLLVPLGPFQSPISFTGDLILFAYLLAVGRFFTTAAALDTGSPFEGMGAAREVTFACLSEPVLFFALLVLAKMSGTLILGDLLHAPLTVGIQGAAASLVLVAIGMFIVLLAENSRIPVDDPNTHLELTMIHEAMVLDHSGPLLGLILYGASVKLFVLSAVLLHILFPFQSGYALLDWSLFMVEMLGVAVAIGVVESIMARLQMRHVPYLLIAAILFCAFGFVLLVR